MSVESLKYRNTIMIKNVINVESTMRDVAGVLRLVSGMKVAVLRYVRSDRCETIE